MTPISPELALAMNVAANPGVYALLLGSGVSRSAGIPTGWDVVLDLVSKLAVAAGSDAQPDPEGWYQSEYGEPPRYSTLLEELAPAADERRSLLESYFKPTPEEREEGVKTPTDAHRAIARMVAEGWIRVIVTTNFDRLLEVSLEEAGVTPVVIATADQAAGATPLAHSKCTVIKVHGDYLDPRIKNSEDELATYDPPTNDLLDQVFDEYGLIVCGWSAEYDVALRDAIGRCKSRRYTTSWCALGGLGNDAKQLSQNRDARVVEIDGADSFFTELEERVTSIDTTGQRHPMDTRAAVETLKRYLVEERHRIRLGDLVQEATEELVSHLNVEEFPIDSQATDEEIASRVQRLNPLCEQTIALTATGCHRGTLEQDDVWLGVVRRLAELGVVNPAADRWGGMFLYPALLALYAAGLSATAKGRYDLLDALLCTPLRSAHGGEPEATVQSVYPHRIVPEGAAQILFPHPKAPSTNYKTPLSQYLHQVLRPSFAELIPADHAYAGTFDRFEYLSSLIQADLGYETRGYATFGGGCFEWREAWGRWLPNIAGNEIEQLQERWPPLQAGLFGGSIERLLRAKHDVDEFAAQSRWR